MADLGIHDLKHREIDDGFHWSQECIALGERHQCQNAFLLEGEANLLFDTHTQPNSEEVIELVDSILDGEPLDYLAISHPEANHAGNTIHILDRHPETTLIAPAHGSGHGAGFDAEHELYHIDDSADPGGISNDVWYVSGGETINLDPYEVEFVKAYYADHAFSMWMVEHTKNTLFTVDWLGFWHPNENCLDDASEIDRETVKEYLHGFHSNVFPWLKFADPDRIAAAVDELADAYDPDWIAPAHGQVIRANPDEYMALFVETACRLSEQGERDQISDMLSDLFSSRGSQEVTGE